MDVSIRTLETARDRLKLDRLPERQAARIKLIHGSLIYRDRRLEGFDAAAVVEVVEHLDPPRLSAFERVRLRVRPAGDGRADDAEPGVQRDVGERRGRASSGIPTTASSGPGRSSGTGPRASPGGSATRCGSCRSGRWTRRSGRRRRWAVFRRAS